MNKVIYLMDYLSLHRRFIRPASLDELEEVAHRLLCQRFLRVDFSRLNADAEATMLYFLSGVAYAIHGEVAQISPSKYIFSEKTAEKTAEDRT